MSKTLLVYPNPFHAVDHLGRPAGVLHYEPIGDGVTTFDERRFVGAQVQSKILQTFPRGSAQHTIQDTWFTYADEPVKVPATAYYKLAVARGELFAADEESAKLCGIVDRYVEPGTLLEQARDAAIGLRKMQAHEDHDETPPESLTKFAFGPMPEAIKARKEKAEADKKANDEASKKAAADKAAADKAAAEKAAADKRKGGE